MTNLPKSASPSASVGRNRGGGYWCASCGEITKPCEHWAQVREFLSAKESAEWSRDGLLFKAASPSEPPHYNEIREIPEIRNLAVMATEHPCFTNSMVAVVNAYQAGWSARGVRRDKENE